MMVVCNLVFSFLCILFVSVNICEGCSCFFQTDKASYCSSEIVVEAKVTSVSPEKRPYLKGYNIDVTRTFKTTNGVAPVTVFTPPGEGMCGINFVLDNKYIIHGDMSGDVFVTSICKGTS